MRHIRPQICPVGIISGYLSDSNCRTSLQGYHDEIAGPGCMDKGVELPYVIRDTAVHCTGIGVAIGSFESCAVLKLREIRH
jgi:hypothetical protein